MSVICIHIATVETPNFSFEAFGGDDSAALDSLREGLALHGRQYGLAADWAAPYIEKAEIVKRASGLCYRDGEQLNAPALNVLQYFARNFPSYAMGGDPDREQALQSMPLDSGCGDDCKAAIDAGCIFAGTVEFAHGKQYGGEWIAAVQKMTLSICSTYISG